MQTIKRAIKDFPSKLFQIRSRAQFPLTSIKMPDEIFLYTKCCCYGIRVCSFGSIVSLFFWRKSRRIFSLKFDVILQSMSCDCKI